MNVASDVVCDAFDACIGRCFSKIQQGLVLILGKKPNWFYSADVFGILLKVHSVMFC